MLFFHLLDGMSAQPAYQSKNSFLQGRHRKYLDIKKELESQGFVFERWGVTATKAGCWLSAFSATKAFLIVALVGS